MKFRKKNYIDISFSEQLLCIVQDNAVVHSFPVSTAKNGPGEQMGSECTPRGWHKIRAKIGSEQPLNSVFIGRRATGEVYTSELGLLHPQRDWILTRILWLGGQEPGKNRFGAVDSTWRYIYIHGCPDQLMKGKPESHGCIRMSNIDVRDLFEQVRAGEMVNIHE